eukprot:2904623-Pleurochrysis_carterae.AAC.1
MSGKDLVQCRRSLLVLVVALATRLELFQLRPRSIELSTGTKDIFPAVTATPRHGEVVILGRDMCGTAQRVVHHHRGAEGAMRF